MLGLFFFASSARLGFYHRRGRLYLHDIPVRYFGNLMCLGDVFVLLRTKPERYLLSLLSQMIHWLLYL